MAIAFVQAADAGTGSSTTLADAFGSNVAAGSLLVSVEGEVGTTNTVNTPTDTLSNTFAQTDTQLSISTVLGSMWYAANTPGGADTITENLLSSGSNLRQAIAEFSGVATSSPIDGSKHQTNSGTSTTATSGSAITASVGDLIVAGLVGDEGNLAIANGGTGAAFTITNPISNHNGALAYAIDTTGGTYIANWSWDATSHNWVSLIAVFKPFNQYLPPVDPIRVQRQL